MTGLKVTLTLEPMLPTADAEFLRGASSLSRHALFGAASLAVLVCGLGGWAMVTNISGAVIGSGVIVVDGGAKLIQHQEGGITKEILVQNEDRVEAGQLLVRLDDTTVRANLDIILSQLRDALALQARLNAESTGSEKIELDSIAASWPDDPELASMLESQEQLRQARRASLDGQTSQLNEQVSQQQQRTAGLEAQREGLVRQLELIGGELANLEKLLAQGLVAVSRVNEMRRGHAQLEGQLGQIDADMAATKASIAQLELMRDRVVQDFLADILNTLAAADRTVAELWQKRLAALDLLRRTEIRAPIEGIVHQSVVQTVGGIVGPGQVLMRIVPQQADPVIDVRVNPLDVDKIYVGQGAIVRMSSLETRVTPDLSGEIQAISADLSGDPASGAQFYQARLRLPPSELSKLPADVKLVPGMPVETFIQTGDRTVWSYLTRPITEQFNRSMRE